MGTRRKWTDEKLAEIEKLAKQMTCKEAAKIFGVTHKALMGVAYYHGISFNHPGKKKKHSKLTSEDVFLIRALAKENMPSREIAEKFDVNKTWVNRIIKGTERPHG